MKHLVVENTHNDYAQNKNGYSIPWVTYCYEHVHFMDNEQSSGDEPSGDDQPSLYTITVASNNSNYGTVTGEGTFPYGLIITIIAMPSEGYTFVMWNDGNTNTVRNITVTQDITYTAIFASSTPKTVLINLKSNANAADASVIYNNTIYPADVSIDMNEGETCTLYTLPDYATFNNITSSKRLPFMGFKGKNGVVIDNRQTSIDTSYIYTTYIASSSDDTIQLYYGGANNVANVLFGYPYILSNTNSPFIDNYANYIYVEQSSNQLKGAGYFISADNIPQNEQIVASCILNNDSFDPNIHIFVANSKEVPNDYIYNRNDYAWLYPPATIDVSISIPENSNYEFVKWKIDRVEQYYLIGSLGGTGYYPLYRDDDGNYGNDYFENYFNVVYDQPICTIPYPGCHIQITPILRVKTT